MAVCWSSGLRLHPAASFESSQRRARAEGVHEPDAGAAGVVFGSIHWMMVGKAILYV